MPLVTPPNCPAPSPSSPNWVGRACAGEHIAPATPKRAAVITRTAIVTRLPTPSRQPFAIPTFTPPHHPLLPPRRTGRHAQVPTTDIGTTGNFGVSTRTPASSVSYLGV